MTSGTARNVLFAIDARHGFVPHTDREAACVVHGGGSRQRSPNSKLEALVERADCAGADTRLDGATRWLADLLVIGGVRTYEMA
jgi:hypothetical protein